MALSPKIKQFAALAMMGAAMSGDTSHNLSMDHVRNDHLPAKSQLTKKQSKARKRSKAAAKARKKNRR